MFECKADDPGISLLRDRSESNTRYSESSGHALGLKLTKVVRPARVIAGSNQAAEVRLLTPHS
jgi:hypothetical protein